jgi:hypothetical protein
MTGPWQTPIIVTCIFYGPSENLGRGARCAGSLVKSAADGDPAAWQALVESFSGLI